MTCLTGTILCVSDGFIFSTFPGLTAGDSITPQRDKVTATEGESVTLTCSYETSESDVWLNWYRHDSDLQAPQFILYKGARSQSGNEYIPDNRYDSETSPTSTNLTIAALTLADTALYYCRIEAPPTAEHLSTTQLQTEQSNGFIVPSAPVSRQQSSSQNHGRRLRWIGFKFTVQHCMQHHVQLLSSLPMILLSRLSCLLMLAPDS
uniref:Ig-like domain-containing protein n=1 Tax=Astatotilapia calliptera TaxID=8154 RepID=A0A3P8QKR4_ASTCA